MRCLPRRLALLIFGVLWIIGLLLFWVTKNKLEVPAEPEVQTPKVRGSAARRARGSGLQEGAQPACRVCGLLGSQVGGLGAASR